MVFSEPAFLFLFLPVLLGLHALCPARARNTLLLLASLLFYAVGEGLWTVVMLVSIASNYVFGLWVERARGSSSPRLPVVAAVVVNLGLLVAFKYANFLADQGNALAGLLGFGAPFRLDPVHLPVGVSFFTFQALSYVLDVHRRDTPVQRNAADLGLYVTLFPQLIAGPIVRYRDVDDQIASRRVTLDLVAEGVRRFVQGLAKKVLVANVVAQVADRAFDVPAESLTASLAWTGMLCYALQIYFDFSGYSDMAVGLGLLFGFRFVENFDHPYVAQSVTEFWRRWHISLSTWFRDYLYIPLGGNRGGEARTFRNLVVVFLLCGLWHGAAWTFVAWGAWHGLFLVLERVASKRGGSPVPRPLRHAWTLLVVLVGWVFFRAESFSQAADWLAAMAGAGPGDGRAFAVGQLVDPFVVLAIVAGVVLSVPVAGTLRGALDRAVAAGSLGRGVRAAADVALHQGLLFACVVSSAGGAYNPFIYFRF